MIKRLLPILLYCCLPGSKTAAQQVIDSICFHLYTDSLKKGVYNYINVDARLHNGNWLPLSSKELLFTASGGRWDGNSLILDSTYPGEFVTITATLKGQPALTRTTRIYLKKKIDEEPLKTEREILDQYRGRKKRGHP